MRVVVLEDEAPALAQMVRALTRAAPDVTIAATFETVADAARWLESHAAPDLVVSDIQLADGSALDLLAGAPFPVVFATAYDRYLLEAFESQAVDYLLKPIDDRAVAHALEKYRRFAAHFSRTPRQRIVARKAGGLLALAVGDVRYLRADDKLVLAVLADGSERIVDRTLAELEAELDPRTFFRLNRRYLVHARAIVGWKSVGKGRTCVTLVPRTADDVFVSQENGAAFRAFIDA